jgi:hypothetical protein
MCQEHDEDEGEYLGEIPEIDHCMMCNASEVEDSDRWNFQLEDESGTGVDNFWLCRACHERFETVEEFDKFRRDWNKMCLYASAAVLQRFLVKGAPEVLIAHSIKTIFMRAVRDQGELGKFLLEELKRKSPDSYEAEEI